jgi:hypothetical protein
MALGIPMALIISSAISAGASAYGASQQGGGDAEYDYKQMPDYPEAEGARGMWWDTLQKWGKDPNYGAISPDWEDIWEKAKTKVNQFYWGSATSPGLAGKIRASAARKGMSDSPATEMQLTRMGAEQGTQLGNFLTDQNTQRASLTERARNTWLGSLTGLSQLKPQFMGPSGYSQASPNYVGDIAGLAGQGLSTYAQYKDQQNWLDKLYSGNQTPGSTEIPVTQDYLSTGVFGHSGLA